MLFLTGKSLIRTVSERAIYEERKFQSERDKNVLNLAYRNSRQSLEVELDRAMKDEDIYYINIILDAIAVNHRYELLLNNVGLEELDEIVECAKEEVRNGL